MFSNSTTLESRPKKNSATPTSSAGVAALVSATYLPKKRITDLLILACFAPFYLPLMVAIAMLVKVSSAGPIFYSQRRLGLRGMAFQAWKFRTMVPNADDILQEYLATNPELQAEWDKDHKLRNDPRITRIGKILRKTSLDELPQLWNVFVGDMSLVGPRPIVQDEVAKYGLVFEEYKQVLPGITGFWQVSGRNNTTYEKRVSLDSEYVRNWSLGWDMRILFRTVKTVLLREGAF